MCAVLATPLEGTKVHWMWPEGTKPQLIGPDKITVKHSYVSFPARVPTVCSFWFGARRGFSPLPDSKSRPQRSISDSPLKVPKKCNTWNAQVSLEAWAILENLNFSMQGKILFTYLLLCKQQVDGAWLLNNAISPQRCVCLCDGLAGVRGHPCLLLQRKRCFLMPVDYTENAVSYSNRVLELYHFNEWAHCSSGCEMMLFKVTH